MTKFGTVEKEITFSLGENGIKFFTCGFLYSYDTGDYYTPADEDYEICTDILDEEGNIVTDLIEINNLYYRNRKLDAYVAIENLITKVDDILLEDNTCFQNPYVKATPRY